MYISPAAKSAARHFSATFLSVFALAELPVLESIGAGNPINTHTLGAVTLSAVAGALAAGIRGTFSLRPKASS